MIDFSMVFEQLGQACISCGATEDLIVCMPSGRKSGKKLASLLSDLSKDPEDTKAKYRVYCRLCAKAMQQKDRQPQPNIYEQRKAVVIEKLGGACRDCGENDPSLLAAYRCDGVYNTLGWNRMFKEILAGQEDVYVLRCRNCQTRSRRGQPRNTQPRTEKQKQRTQKECKRQYARRRSEVIAALGGRCVRCGFTDERALQIDHVNGGGVHEHRYLAYSVLYRKVIASVAAGKNEYQLLCANCNWIKRAENDENRRPT